ncbi:hypothetical protein [Novosphingobium mangrovi (ex Hu et al. 2023)]|uniref:Copper resistance protein D domain-containing protein n=1 Tax=Novosphingobium mangrovi (ex Hu et al. 2023) TaxID=2930094 RepID=A0ABT0A9R6_9SPHN|nr:hypothetical protein [Novosphingobium mangrovi (ex Hu et al. 2023)]MCJ1959922.1 hypothetical protein [Novosphingobium mangrovi (ex Hu et al. 2023)]
MDHTLALLTLLHLLIPIYWLGGDLGAFYSSRFLVDPKRTVPERLLALHILNNIDMAPRTALILAFPTGFTLAAMKGWLAVSGLAVTGVWVAGLAWLALAWAVHILHGPAGKTYKQIDLAIRYIVLAALVAGGVAGLVGAVTLPLFIALKLLVLAFCIFIGLLVRRQLVPLIPAIVDLAKNGASPEGDKTIAGVLAVTQPTVMTLWAAVLIASFLGIATPL